MALSKWAHRIAGLSVAGVAVAALVASSCAEAEGRFFVECISKQSTDTCGCDTDVVAGGSFNKAACDVGADGKTLGTCGYQATFVLKNQMVSSLSIAANNNNVETSEIQVYAADISFETTSGSIAGAQGATLLAPVPPDDTACISASLFDGASVDVAEGEVVNAILTVKFYGRTTGGLEVETPTQYFPIAIYNDPNDCDCGVADSGKGSNGVPIECKNPCS